MFVCFIFICDKVSLCNLGRLRILCVDHVGLKLKRSACLRLSTSPPLPPILAGIILYGDYGIIIGEWKSDPISEMG